jgi:hypothetical protein
VHQRGPCRSDDVLAPTALALDQARGLLLPATSPGVDDVMRVPVQRRVQLLEVGDQLRARYGCGGFALQSGGLHELFKRCAVSHSGWKGCVSALVPERSQRARWAGGVEQGTDEDVRLAVLPVSMPAFSDGSVRLRGSPLGREADRHMDWRKNVSVRGELLSEIVGGADQVALSRLHDPIS